MLAVFNKEVLGAVGSVHCNHSTDDPEVGELPWLPGQPGLHSEIPSQETEK